MPPFIFAHNEKSLPFNASLLQSVGLVKKLDIFRELSNSDN
jgi:hypothetical protein